MDEPEILLVDRERGELRRGRDEVFNDFVEANLRRIGPRVAGSAIVMLATTLSASGVIPVESIGLILGVHRLLSSAFVPVNVLGNALATIAVSRMERALDLETMESQLRSGAPT